MSDNLLSSLSHIFRHELLLAYRQRREFITPLAFFVMMAMLFPLAVSPDPLVLQRLAPGIIWVGALLATLLSLDRLFLLDYLEGVLQQWVLSPRPLSLLVLTKVLAHWLILGLPLVIIAPLLGLFLHLPLVAVKILVVSLLLGTPTLSLIGAIGVALTVGLRNSGVLLALLMLPLYIPVLIFGASAVSAAADGLMMTGQLAWLGVLLILSLSLAPLAIAGALRIGVN